MGSFEKILDLLFPPRCPLCGKLGKGICPDCDAKLPLVGQAQTVRRVGSFRCAAPLWYEGVAREGLLRLKFRGTRSAARSFGELLARCAAEEFSGEFDVVTWVPVSKKRLRKRGFDQARLLAEEACRLWDRSPERLLVKIADNPAQSSIRGGVSARRANVLGVYEVRPGADVAGRRILLIDDICTSGSTLKECVRVLEEAGAQSVVCAVAAHAKEKIG